MSTVINTRLHSFVDIITNSSTVVYTSTNANGIQMVKDIVNEIISAVTTTSINADDLYDINIVPADHVYETAIDTILSDEGHEHHDRLQKIYDDTDAVGWRERKRLLTEYVQEHFDPEQLYNMCDDDWSGYNRYEDKLVIKSKHGQDSVIDKHLANLFSTVAISDN